MDFNTLLLRLGISPDNFINKEGDAIPINSSFIYDVEQTKEDRTCPHCGDKSSVVYGYYFSETNCY